LHAVTRLLHARGGSLPRMHRNHYAVALHALVRRGTGTRELLDRLLVAALIEARSCERFELLAEAADDRDLRALYVSLRGSEQAHYRLFLKLAGTLVPAAEVTARWSEMCSAEAATMAAQPAGPRIHAGCQP
jgi:tRNA-(ms[2]io[6]A)-hydroxylase